MYCRACDAVQKYNHHMDVRTHGTDDADADADADDKMPTMVSTCV